MKSRILWALSDLVEGLSVRLELLGEWLREKSHTTPAGDPYFVTVDFHRHTVMCPVTPKQKGSGIKGKGRCRRALPSLGEIHP